MTDPLCYCDQLTEADIVDDDYGIECDHCREVRVAEANYQTMIDAKAEERYGSPW